MAQSVAKLMKILKEDIESSMGVPEFANSEKFRAHAMNSAMYAMQQRQYEIQKAQYDAQVYAAQMQQDLSNQLASAGAATYASQRSSGGTLTEASLNEALERAYNELSGKVGPVHRKRHILVRWLRASLDPDFSLRDENLHDDGPVL